mgnify:CR=1 FL=1
MASGWVKSAWVPLCIFGTVLAVGCAPQTTGPSGASAPSVQTPGASVATAAGAVPAQPTAAGSIAVVPPAVAAAGHAAPVTGTPVGTAAGSVAIPDGSAVGTGSSVPCDVAPVLSKHCAKCHSAVPKFGAPMPLVTAADFLAMSKLNPSMTVAQTIPPRINATEQARLMPPVTSSKLAANELQSLNDWVRGGAKPAAGAAACPVTDAPTGTTSPEVTGPAPTGPRMGGASLVEQQYDDPDMKCYQFLTHAQGDKDAPYTQGQGEQYVNFSFKAPWTGTQYLRAIKLVNVDNAPVLHHWLLFKDTTMKQDGAVMTSSGAHTDGAVLLHGWAPGANPIFYDKDVGMKMESNVSYTLEAHLYNATGSPGKDHSGAEVCVTPKVPEHVVDISWVGTDNIAGTTATGNCTPAKRTEPIHIIAAQPHLHKKGMHQKVTINRADGTKKVIHDKPFSFDDQRYYVLDEVLMPGDTMTTTCQYSAPSTFGSSSDAEMCYFFTIAWPAGAVGTRSVIHGANTCIN